MSPWDFIQTIPNIAIAIIGFVIALGLWMLWRNIAPAAPGISLGYYEVLGRYAGQKLVKSIRGTLVDCTSIFLNPEVDSQFREILIEDLKLRKNNPAENKNELDILISQLEANTLQNLCRIIITRDRLVGKHILIQYGAVDKPLNAYASHDPSSKFTFSFGFLSQGVITGEIWTLPQPLKIHGIGKANVHVFKPDIPQSENNATVPDWLPKIALYAPATVEYEKRLQSERELRIQAERQAQEASLQTKAIAAERDALYRIVEGISPTGEIPKGITPRRFDLLDYILLATPTIIAYFIAENMGASPIVGVSLGLLFGAYMVFRRR